MRDTVWRCVGGAPGTAAAEACAARWTITPAEIDGGLPAGEEVRRPHHCYPHPHIATTRRTRTARRTGSAHRRGAGLELRDVLRRGADKVGESAAEREGEEWI